MAQLEPLQNEIAHSGSLLYVAAEKRHGMFKPAQYLAEHPVSFPFLLDEERTVTKQYGVYHRLATDAFHIARPASFVIDASGTIRYIYVGSSQTDRAPVEPLLQALAAAK